MKNRPRTAMKIKSFMEALCDWHAERGSQKGKPGRKKVIKILRGRGGERGRGRAETAGNHLHMRLQFLQYSPRAKTEDHPRNALLDSRVGEKFCAVSWARSVTGARGGGGQTSLCFVQRPGTVDRKNFRQAGV